MLSIGRIPARTARVPLRLQIASFAVALALVFTHAPAALAFETVVLDNGLTVLLDPGHAHPVIATELYVTTGSRTEDEYYQGSLHYIEHLVFKGGTPNLEPTQFRKRMSLLGRESGGWTWNDEINFGFETPKESYREALGVFREALTALEFEEEWFESEKKVVFQEMERGFERPSSLLYNAWYETAFRVHPYGRPVIGSEKAVGELEMTRTEQYYRDRFSPNHMILSIAGDFDRDEMLDWIEAEWGSLEPGPESFELGLVEPEQKGPRWREEYLEQATNALHLVGVVTGGGAEDAPALSLLGDLLSSSSYGLPQYLVEQEKWVTSVSAGAYTMRDYGTFTAYASMDPASAAAVIPFIREFLLAFDVREVPAEIFEEVKRAALASEARQRETYVGIAGRNGFLSSRLGLEGARTYADRLAALTPEAVQAAKERWIAERKLVEVTVYPESYTKADDGRRVEPHTPSLTPAPDLNVAGALAPPEGAAPLVYRATTIVDDVHGFLFENGLRLVVRPTDASDVLAVSGRVMGGQWVEPEDRPGVNRFVSELGMRATRRWGREGFARLTSGLAVDASAHTSVGSRVNTSRNVDYRDSAAHHYAGLSAQAPEMLAMLKETLFFPDFESAEVEKLRSDLIEEVRRLPENNLEYIKQEFYVRLYRGHPYGRPTVGTDASLAALTPESLERFHLEQYAPDRTIVSVVGNVVPEEIAEWISVHWADMPATHAGSFDAFAPEGWPAPEGREVMELGKDQWTVNWGRPGVPYADPRQRSSQVLSSMAGNDHFYRYVYEEGVSYRSWIRFWSNLGAGTWILENDVQRERFDEILDMFDADIARYSSEGFSREEFADAVQRLVNAQVLGLQQNSRLAWSLAVAEGNGVGFRYVTRGADAIRKVTYEETQALAREMFDPASFYRLVQK